MGSSESTQAAFSKSTDSIDLTTSVSVDDFELLKKVGEGAFASVWMARTKRDGRKVAVKMQDKAHVLRTGTVKGVVAERDILASIRHPFIVRLLWAFQARPFSFVQPHARARARDCVCVSERARACDADALASASRCRRTTSISSSSSRGSTAATSSS